MTEYLRVKDHPNLVRDKRSNAILNTNENELAKYKAERDYKLRMTKVADDFDSLKSEVSELKNLLLKILEQK